MSHPLAYLIVICSAVAAVLFVRTVVHWTRWLLAAAGAIGIAGLVLAAGAVVNLGVSRTCASQRLGGQVLKETNRPVISVVLGGDDCYADALGQFEILGVIVVAVSAEAVRRSRPSASAPAPAVPPV